MENNNGKGIFYGVIGVATLIVAIIGATFAYFTATTRSGEYLTGTAATASLEVHVKRLTGFSAGEGTGVTADTAKFVMVPQLDKGLSSAIRGSEVTENKPCIDANGSLVCSIYKITVRNTGTAAMDVSGSIAFYATTELTANDTSSENPTVTPGDNKMNHLKWARLEDPTTLTAGYTYEAANSNSDIPNTLLTYTGNYQTLSDGTNRTYATASANQYLFGMSVTEGKDLLGVAKTEVNGAHGAYTDIIDPTDDLLPTSNYSANGDATNGLYRLAANGVTGDTKVYYIVVWISENEASQNADDFGSFTGQVTFNSANGSGSTSTFTEVYGG